MRFKAKSGVEREIDMTDKSLIRIVRNCQDLPGQHLFQYLDEEGEPRPIGSEDVNDYIREATGEDFTAKHFRTWGASAIAFEQVCAAGEEGVGPQGDAGAGGRGARQHADHGAQILCPPGADRGGEARQGRGIARLDTAREEPNICPAPNAA